MNAKLSGAIGSSTMRREPGSSRASTGAPGLAKAWRRTNREEEP